MLDPSIIVGANQVPAVGGSGLLSSSELDKVRQEQQAAETRAKLLSAVLELQSQLDTCRDFESAATQAARLIAEIAPVQRLQIAWREKENAAIEIVADNHGGSAEEARLAAAAAEEISVRGSIAVLPCPDHSNRHALLATRQYADSIAAKTVVGVPMTDRQGKPLGAIVASNSQAESIDLVVGLLEVLGPMLSGKLAHLQTMQPRRWERFIRSLADSAAEQPRRIAVVMVAVFTAVMLIPVGYNVPAVCELQPVQRRFVAAPFDGPLENVYVRPGDVVQKGDLLARINPREIEYQLAGLRADLMRAVQEKKGLVAEHDFAGSKIAGLEAKRIQLDTDLLQYQREHLEIRSPLSGVVVAGDLETSEGTPLSKGETLFEIAPLGQMIVEIGIGEEDLAYVRTGMEVEFYLHALPARNMRGTLRHVHPQAELRNHDNVFIGEVHVEDSEGLLRPGMRGRSWVHSDRHPLGWNLFHQAYFAVRHFLGW
jgi:biotin carboxyl carrier protein